MQNSEAFDHVSSELEKATSFTATEARGTLRLALKSSGLSAASVTPAQLIVVLTRVLPDELRCRGIDGGTDICLDLAESLASFGPDAAPAANSPDAVFARIGRG